jgi:uncharacterized protein (TIGR00290 family)
VAAGAAPRLLATMMDETGSRSRSHGLRRSVLEAQAAAIGLPIRFASATWATYEARFTALAARAAEAGASAAVFGDIDLEEHRAWEEAVCAAAGLAAHLPLWRRDRADLLDTLLGAGFRAVIVAVREDRLPATLLGRAIDAATLGELERAGVDLAGENGEYHTLVVDGPIFRRPLDVVVGERSLRHGLWFADVLVGSA